MPLTDLIAPAATVAGTVVVIVIGRLILNRSITDARTVPYHRQIFSLAVTLIGLFVAIALLPIPSELRAQILSVLGILLSAVVALSSTTVVGNAMAGIMLRVMKGFRAGDFIQFDDKLGRVTDIGFFHTEMQLITRDIVTVPNTLLVQKAVTVTRRGGTFVAADVTIGYGHSHDKVESSLAQAAEACDLAEPFVLITELADHAVRYRVHGLLEDSSELLSKRSQLLRAVLDQLHDAGIETASPRLVDRREYAPDHPYAPPASPPPSSPEEKPIEEIAFDRAEEAESIEQLYAEQEKLKHRLQDASKEEKGRVKERVERIAAEIERREAERDEQRREEERSE